MTCKDCIHEMVCDYLINGGLPYADEKYPADINCLDFKNKTDFVAVVRCKDCGMFVDNKEALVTYCKRECKNLTVNPSDFCSYGERSDT